MQRLLDLRLASALAVLVTSSACHWTTECGSDIYGVCGESETSTSSSSSSTTTSTTSPATSVTSTTDTTTGEPMCGDGQVDMGEECDDGENNGDDKACTSECTNNVCGDGYVLSGVEECDDGNISNTDECVDGCKLATCGDGFIQEDKEECDDGNDVDTDTCPTSCKPASCGDGFVQQGKEECDDGNQSNTDACTNACKAAACGDGYVQGDEACDDGNTDDLDACSGDCATSRRFVFVTADVYDGNLGGLAGADALCNGLVDDARADMVPAFLAGRTFKAWLSDDTQSPDTRFSAKGEGFGGTYVMIDSTKDPVELVPVAVGWAGLVSGMLDHPLDHDQQGKLIQANEVKEVWSNTQPDGTGGKWAMAQNQLDDAHCQNWSSTVGIGNTGLTDLATGNWTAKGLKNCDGAARLYCIEDP
ncbi:MAG: DUF4215 domain-containing protein [Myxococcales bacterium]|nr:DUF4215 domain-containing protein [Myxococcales bacterium]